MFGLDYCWPKAGALKCNIDVTVFHEIGGYGIRMSPREDIGDFIASNTFEYKGYHNLVTQRHVD